MQIEKCPVVGCMQPEVWNSQHDVKEHAEKYHPGTNLIVEDGRIVADDMPIEDKQLVDEVLEQRAYEFADWANYYMSGSFQEVFADIFQETFDLLVARQHKYGPKNIEQQGAFGVFTRLRDDKMSRVARAMNGTIVNGKIQVTIELGDEEEDTYEDALKDIANYALIMLCLYRGKWGAPLQEEL